MTLYFYFAKRFLGAFVRVFAVLALLIFVLETLENIRGLSKHGVDFGQAAWLAAFSSPELVLQAMPIIVMLGGLTFCVGLARSNEFVVTRAVGVSALKAMVAPSLSAFGLGLAAMLVLNPLSAFFAIQHDSIRETYTNSNTKTVSFSEDGFWLRQKDADGHTVIHAESANSRGTSLRGATALEFDAEGQLVSRLYSRTAILREGEWVFTNGKYWRTDRTTANPESTSEVFEIKRFPTDITPEQILEGYPKPEAVPLWDKWRTIRAIGDAGFSTLPHRIHLNMELARPLMLMAMMIIGAAFTLQNARMGNLGVSVFIALICGFSLYFLQNLAMTLGEAGEIPVFAAAWAPPLAANLFAVGLFLRFEDG
ncbi:LPS export ABC transporter permease LptG [Neptunicoccus cionae]|uniref:LPS export ABC transporter permease LptG n=1 Tax=Neptunicoccus cionae TaxID=2035344 RepID=UPI000C763148|nr:LPS export ABC transporter permease LptG [Amylibacter cionae]PLS20333.1 LPS export ABC transporter permease LptG [Amylibacter cionae]